MIILTAAKNQLYAIALQKLNVCNFMYIYLYDSKFTNDNIFVAIVLFGNFLNVGK